MSKPSHNEIAETIGVSPNQVASLCNRGMPDSSIKKARKWFEENGFSKVNHHSAGKARRQAKTLTKKVSPVRGIA